MAAIPASHAAVTFVTGTTNATRIGDASTTGITDAHGAATGTFNTTAGTGSAGVSFDLTITASNTLHNQSGGLGVDGGSAVAGIDNNNTAGPQEWITLGISNFSGLAAGETLVITQVELSFGGNGGETYTINGGSDIAFVTEPESIDIPDGATVTIGAGSAGDTKFAISSFTVEAVPEPSSTALIGLGGLALILRRRK